MNYEIDLIINQLTKNTEFPIKMSKKLLIKRAKQEKIKQEQIEQENQE